MGDTVHIRECWELFSPAGALCALEFDGDATLFFFRTEQVARAFCKRLLDEEWTPARVMTQVLFSQAALLSFQGCERFAYVETCNDRGLGYRLGRLADLVGLPPSSRKDGLPLPVENGVRWITDGDDEHGGEDAGSEA